MAVSGIDTAVQVATGGAHTCAVLNDGGVRCWGAGLNGQLGDGSTTSSSTPVVVNGIDTAVQVAVAGGYTCAVLSDGSVQCWGHGSSGQLATVVRRAAARR